MAELIGKEIAKKYIIRKILGEGGAGCVYQALVKDSDLGSQGKYVALKKYKSWVLEKPEQARRILREYSTGKFPNSPHLVSTHDIFQNEDGFFLVMEYINGQTLSDLIKKKPLQFTEIIDYLRDLLDGLSVLHDEGLIHRDLKPDNIMVREGGLVIMDLGVLKDLTSSSTAITGTEFLGTIKYAASEYLFGKNYDKSIDLYSIGVCLYEMIFQQKLFNDYWSVDIISKHEIESFGSGMFFKNISILPNTFTIPQKIFLWFLLLTLLNPKEDRLKLGEFKDALLHQEWMSIFNWNLFYESIITYNRKRIYFSDFYAFSDFKKVLDADIIWIEEDKNQELFGECLFLKKGCNISKIKISDNQNIINFPDSVKYFTKLEYIQIQDCPNLISLSNNIVDLKTLRELQAINQKLNKLPLYFENLPSLEILTLNISNFHNKYIVELPPSLKILKIKEEHTRPPIKIRFAKMQKLKKLSISGRGLSQLFDSISLLENLEELSIERAPELICSPEEIAKLKNLKVLQASRWNFRTPHITKKFEILSAIEDQKNPDWLEHEKIEREIDDYYLEIKKKLKQDIKNLKLVIDQYPSYTENNSLLEELLIENQDIH